jgi:taurine dioxygenase
MGLQLPAFEKTCPMDATVNRLSEVMAAEIEGIDLREPLDPATITEINDVFVEHCAVCFRDQNLDLSEFIAAAKQFGRPQKHLYRAYRLKGFPEVSIVSNEDKDTHGTGQKFNRAAHFHSDEIYKETPCKATLLYAVKVPSEGGETRFLNLRNAYDTLPAELKAKIDGLKGLFRHQHSAFKTARDDPNLVLPKLSDEEANEVPDVIHPIVRTHPENGRKSLFITNTRTEHIIDMDASESAALLQSLYDHLYTERFEYRHFWRKGDLVMWDNRCLLHAATPNVPEGEARRLYRTILEGTRPF